MAGLKGTVCERQCVVKEAVGCVFDRRIGIDGGVVLQLSNSGGFHKKRGCEGSIHVTSSVVLLVEGVDTIESVTSLSDRNRRLFSGTSGVMITVIWWALIRNTLPLGTDQR